MSTFGSWMKLVDPIMNRVLAIIPHLKEIINIAFKPFNGSDILDDHDHKHLKNRIMFIDEKIHYGDEKPVRTFLLNHENRSNIIMSYSNRISQLEKSLVTEVIKPVIEHLSSENDSIFDHEANPFLIHFQKEMKHSLLLPEKEFFMSPIKKILIGNLEEGLKYLLDMHPKKFDARQSRSTYYQKLTLRGTRQEAYGSPFVQNSKILGLVGYSTYVWNLIGLREDLFLTQFYETNFRSTYMICFTRACGTFVNSSGNIRILEDIFDKLIVESGLLIRTIQSLSYFDDSLTDYFYPRMPLDNNLSRIKSREIENIDHWRE
uniref:ORF5 protein n=1 Tax=Carrot ophiovirus 1 TaxID=2976692 RepID=A0A977N6B9_9VIRU|nr:ORF5 protein [Carrot ophiovirus 1]